jgi:opacity protein-like surface antigen
MRNARRTIVLTFLLLATLVAMTQATEAQEIGSGLSGTQFGWMKTVHNLEGPGVNGHQGTTPGGEELEGIDESGFGAWVRGRYALGSRFHLTLDGSAERIAGNVNLLRGFVLPGVHFPLGQRAALYAEAGVQLARTSGLEDYAGRTAAAVAGGGSDVALGGLLGVRYAFGSRVAGHLASGYFDFGEVPYPAGFDEASSSGEGPVFEWGLGYRLNDQFDLRADWQGTWIEDGEFLMDLATQQFRLGLNWKN